MNAQAVVGVGALEGFLTANDRFKRGFGAWFWGSMVLATAIHFSVFALWPEMTAEDVSYSDNPLQAIELPPEIEIPPPPQAIQRPAMPVVATDVNVSEDITIAPTTFADNPVSSLPPPPSNEVTTAKLEDAPVFTPFTVKPEMKNRDEVARALEREYPPLLRDAGIGGTVLVWFFIDENGKVVRTIVNQSSGHRALDDAALKVAQIAQFTPALNRDKRVPVWISLPITFTTR